MKVPNYAMRQGDTTDDINYEVSPDFSLFDETTRNSILQNDVLHVAVAVKCSLPNVVFNGKGLYKASILKYKFKFCCCLVSKLCLALL